MLLLRQAIIIKYYQYIKKYNFILFLVDGMIVAAKESEVFISYGIF